MVLRARSWISALEDAVMMMSWVCVLCAVDDDPGERKEGRKGRIRKLLNTS
jgi:hypothetical protein